MKLRHVFSVVIGVHLAVIALLFVTPGCQSSGGESSGERASRGGFTAGDTSAQHARHAQGWQTGPVHTPGNVNSDGQLYSPSRPSWNVNDSNTAAPVSVLANDESVEVLQPVRSGATDSSGFGELVPVTSDTGLGYGSVTSTGGGTSYRVQTGDNLTRIATKHGVSVGALMSANGLTRDTANMIRVGQELKIPAGGQSQVAQSQTVSAPVAASGESYTVRSGDTLGAIATRHGTTVAALRSANNISGDRINIGQTLKLPSGANAPQQSQTSTTPAATANTATTSEGGYTVRSGETLGGIAARHGTTVQALMQANNIDDPRSLRAGQSLRLPGSSSATTSTGSSTPTPRSTTSGSTTTTGTTPSSEPAPTLPSSFSPSSSQGSGDDLLNDFENIPTVQAQ